MTKEEAIAVVVEDEDDPCRLCAVCGKPLWQCEQDLADEDNLR